MPHGPPAAVARFDFFKKIDSRRSSAASLCPPDLTPQMRAYPRREPANRRARELGKQRLLCSSFFHLLLPRTFAYAPFCASRRVCKLAFRAQRPPHTTASTLSNPKRSLEFPSGSGDLSGNPRVHGKTALFFSKALLLLCTTALLSLRTFFGPNAFRSQPSPGTQPNPQPLPSSSSVASPTSRSTPASL